MLSASAGVVSEDIVRSNGRGGRTLELDFEVFFFLCNETHILVLFGVELWLMVGGLGSEFFALVLWGMRVNVCS